MSTPTPGTSSPALSLDVTPGPSTPAHRAEDHDVVLDASAPADDGEDDTGPVDRLAQLREEINRPIAERPPVTYNSPGRPGYGLRFRTDLSEEDLKRARRQARAGNRAARRGAAADGEIDQLKFNLHILATYNTAVLVGGEEILLPSGRPLRFATRDFLELAGAPDAYGAIRKWFGNSDGSIIGMGMAVVAASPYAEEPEDDDEDAVLPPTELR